MQPDYIQARFWIDSRPDRGGAAAAIGNPEALGMGQRPQRNWREWEGRHHGEAQRMDREKDRGPGTEVVAAGHRKE